MTNLLAASRSLKAFLMVAMLTLAPACVHAAALYGVTGGATVPTTHDRYESNGTGFNVGLVCDRVDPRVLSGVEAGLTSYRSTISSPYYFPSPYSNTVVAVSLRAHLKYLLQRDRNVTPYLMAGMGVWRTTWGGGAPHGAPVVELGLGANLSAGQRHSLAVEAAYEAFSNRGGEQDLLLLRLALLWGALPGAGK